MKTTLGEVYNAREALAELSGIKLPYDILYKLTVIIENAEKACDFLNQEIQKINVEELGVEIAQSKLDELAFTKIELQGTPINRESFENYLKSTNQVLSPKTLFLSDFIFDIPRKDDTSGFTILE